MELRPLSEVESRPIDWLWLARLGLGKPALLEGDRVWESRSSRSIYVRA